MFGRNWRRIAPAPTVLRDAGHDPVLGPLAPSADADWWEARVPVGGDVVAFKIGGGTGPSPALVAHARDIVRAYPQFRARVAAFLVGEAQRLGPLGDEVRRLEVEDVCLFWPGRPDDGMIFFRGPDDGRVWRCDYLGREPTGLGFDSQFGRRQVRDVSAASPYVWLGPRWYAWLEFGPNARREAFAAVARRVCDEFGGTVTAVLPNPVNDGKEYAEVWVGPARLLLMRKPGIGVGLGAAYPDVPVLLRVAALYGAGCRGWRWPLYRLWRRVVGG